MELRTAGPEDADEIALLHADSWRRTYRGSFSDAFLDGDVVENRLAVWRERLATPAANQLVLLADDAGVLQGFVCAFGDEDATWGSLIDNLHVRYDVKGHGIGRCLMRAAGGWGVEHYPRSGVYLWVLEANHAARGFYERLGASNEGLSLKEATGGGVVASLRYAWASPAALIGGG